MDAGSPLRLEPTFPLDQREISRRLDQQRKERCGQVAAIGFGATVGLTLFFSVFELAALGFLSGLFLSGGALFYRWFHWDLQETEADIIASMIHAHNRSQDEQLEGVVQNLRAQGHHGYASALGKFILLKQHIESNLHRKQTVSPSSQELDNLCDRVCSLTCEHISSLSELDQQIAAALTSRDKERLQRLDQERAHVLLQIQRAYVTMYESLDTLLELKTSTQDAPGLAEQEAERITALEQAIDQLEQENETLKRITQRVKSDLALPPAPSERFEQPGGAPPVRQDRPPRLAQ